MMRPLLINSIRADGRNRNSSCFMMSGKAPPDLSSPKPVVEEDPNATTTSVSPACSFVLVRASDVPSDIPFLKARQASPAACCACARPPKMKANEATSSQMRWRLGLDIDPLLCRIARRLNARCQYSPPQQMSEWGILALVIFTYLYCQ